MVGNSYKNTSRGGAGIGIIIILIILIVGGIYIWQSSIKETKEVPPEEEIVEDQVLEEVIGTLDIEDISGDLGSIEADLELSDFDDLDIGTIDLGI